MGDLTQASEYLKKGLKEEKCLVGYMLKSGVEELLFDKDILAIAKYEAKKQWAGNYMRAISINNKRGDYESASINEGNAGGYLGLKSENAQKKYFSINVGNGKGSRLLFQLLVERVLMFSMREGEKKSIDYLDINTWKRL